MPLALVNPPVLKFKSIFNLFLFHGVAIFLFREIHIHQLLNPLSDLRSQVWKFSDSLAIIRLCGALVRLSQMIRYDLSIVNFFVSHAEI